MDAHKLIVDKDGYTFVADTTRSRGHFHAYKLSELSIAAVDSSGAPLDTVLVSISGGDAPYRSNNLTDASGTITFVGLGPGEYNVRAVLKEYRFEPATATVRVREGSTERVRMVATRHAYR